MIGLAVRELVGEHHHIDLALAVAGPRDAVDHQQAVHGGPLQLRLQLHLLAARSSGTAGGRKCRGCRYRRRSSAARARSGR